MRIAWRTVGAIITRVWADTERQYDQFADLTRIGIDEISYKRGHKYLTCVVDHDSGRLVWAAPGQDKAILATFFDALGQEREYWLLWAPPAVRVSATVQICDVRCSAPLPAWLSTT